MVVVNTQGQEINAKIVYYGPALSGKTTNLEQIYERMPSDAKGKMVSMKTRTDRTLFFDFLPIELGDINGYRTRMLLYTVPGQVYYNATRKLVLKGADAVVFVADSAPGKLAENIESLRNLEENLNELGLSLDTMPWVIQYNKRDLPDAAPVRTIETELNLLRVPSFEAIATQGIGVYETFQGIASILYAQLADRLVATEQRTGHKAAGATAEVRRGAPGSGRDASVSQVIDTGLREVDQPADMPAVAFGIPRSPVCDAKQQTPGPGLSQPGAKQTAAPRPAADEALRMVSLKVPPMNEDVGRALDLERDSHAGVVRIDDDARHEFITGPGRLTACDETEDISGSISTMEAVSLTERTPRAEDECVITVPVVLSRSQIRKTIPIKLRLEVQVVNDDS